jgi:hypothetical protein
MATLFGKAESNRLTENVYHYIVPQALKSMLSF